MREHFDPVVKADQCFQKLDDIGSATTTATDFTGVNRAVFECPCKAGLKQTV